MIAAEYVLAQLRSNGRNADLKVGVILGSGLGRPADVALSTGGWAIRYDDVPEMPASSIVGHAGRLVFGSGELDGVVFLQGRAHHYEGHALEAVTFGIRLLAALGIRSLVVTNAAGGIREGFRPGDLMLIDGHWSFLDVQLRGTTSRPIATDKLWSNRLRSLATGIVTPLRIHEGVYAMMSGPNYETPAEVRMLKTLGADAVGMSTIPEAIEASRSGIEVLGVSCITNIASGLTDAKLDHAEVAEVAGSIDEEFTKWLLTYLTLVVN